MLFTIHNPLVGGSSPPGPTILKGFQGFTVLKMYNFLIEWEYKYF